LVWRRIENTREVSGFSYKSLGNEAGNFLAAIWEIDDQAKFSLRFSRRVLAIKRSTSDAAVQLLRRCGGRSPDPTLSGLLHAIFTWRSGWWFHGLRSSVAAPV
jgi:hypothetical protein